MLSLRYNLGRPDAHIPFLDLPHLVSSNWCGGTSDDSPLPVITSITPTTVLQYAPDRLTIRGSNLGTSDRSVVMIGRHVVSPVLGSHPEELLIDLAWYEDFSRRHLFRDDYGLLKVTVITGAGVSNSVFINVASGR